MPSCGTSGTGHSRNQLGSQCQRRNNQQNEQDPNNHPVERNDRFAVAGMPNNQPVERLLIDLTPLIDYSFSQARRSSPISTLPRRTIKQTALEETTW
jgi:hypothetical protein